MCFVTDQEKFFHFHSVKSSFAPNYSSSRRSETLASCPSPQSTESPVNQVPLQLIGRPGPGCSEGPALRLFNGLFLSSAGSGTETVTPKWKTRSSEAGLLGVHKNHVVLITLSFGSQCPELRVKNPPANAADIRDADSIPRSERSPGGGHGNPLQYPGLENPMDRGAWRAPVHGVAKSWTRVK